jgi:glycosyltransferase involved in cell wall biosynthesis
MAKKVDGRFIAMIHAGYNMPDPFFTLVIPVYNNESQLRICLQAVLASTFTDWELIVVDDGSTDGSAAVARDLGAMVWATSGRCGPAAARNLGAEKANGRYLFFTDSDCQLHTDTLQQTAAILRAHPYLDAVIGSYDDAPAAPNFLSQYKNLLHHYTHQTSQPEATTFWTGCGAIKRTTFRQLGGFDAVRYPHPSIEDIELGYRLTRKGNGRIHLASHIQVKHLKEWRLIPLLRSDIYDRALPWTKLMHEYRHITPTLNVQWHNRLSGFLVLVLVGNLLFIPLYPTLFLGALLWVFILLWLNNRFYLFVYAKNGFVFTCQAILFHWFYYLYSSLAFALGSLSIF